MAWTDNVFQGGDVVLTNITAANANFLALRTAFSGASAPVDPDPGQWWYDTNNNILKLFVASAWKSVWDFGENCPCFGDLATVTDTNKRISLAMMNDASKSPTLAPETIGLRAIGITAYTACAGNDSRLLNMTMTIGTNLVGCNHLETETNEDAYTIAKSFSIIQPGAYKVAFDIKSNYSGETVYGHIYRHDDTSSTAVGAEQSTSSTTYATKTQDIGGWSIGDTLELRIKAPSIFTARTVLVRNFYLYVATANLGVPAAQDRV